MKRLLLPFLLLAALAVVPVSCAPWTPEQVETAHAIVDELADREDWSDAKREAGHEWVDDMGDGLSWIEIVGAILGLGAAGTAGYRRAISQAVRRVGELRGPPKPMEEDVADELRELGAKRIRQKHGADSEDSSA